jgi:hypothetical protein
MKKFMVVGVAIAALVGVLPLANAGATPAPTTAVTIQLVYPDNTFTATGLGTCTSGTTADSGNGGGTRTTLTCADTSGSFAIHFSQYGKGAIPGKWAVVQNSGTGAYAGISGGGPVVDDNCGSGPCVANLAGEVSGLS